MSNIRKKLVLISLILVSALTMFYGCGGDIYNNLKLSLKTSAANGVVTLSDNVQDNVFSVTATTSGMPKGYEGEVKFSIPANDSIELTRTDNLGGGVTVATFYAKAPGNVTISCVTLEGNVSQTIDIKVVKKISGLSFNENLIPIVKGVETDISKYLTFDPLNTNQTDVELELIKLGANDELIKIVRNGSKITVPIDCNIEDFEIVAKSIYNERIFARTNAKIINKVSANDLTIMHDAGTPNDGADDKVLAYSRGEYYLELASNTEDLHERNIYVKFADETEASNYSVKVVGLNDDGSITEDGKVKGVVQVDQNNDTGILTIKAIGLGEDKLILNVYRNDFPNNSEFTQQLIVKVGVKAYPKTITISDGKNTISALDIYANYDDVLIGAPIMFTVNNEDGVMDGESVILSLSGYDDRIQLYDKWGNQLEFNTEISAGTVYYIRHTLTTSPPDLTLTATSAKYNRVTASIPLKIITQGINLTIDNKKETDIKIDIAKNVETQIQLGGLPSGYNYNNLTVVYDKTMLALTQTETIIAFTPLSEIGKTIITIQAPNGSKVRINASLYESLDLITSYVSIAGQDIYPFELSDENIVNIKVKNNLTLPINFVINGKSYSSLPDVLTFDASTENRDIVRINQNKFSLQTQNVKGSSLITVQITGYNDIGEKNKIATFKVNVTVHIPLSDITVASKEVTIYNYKTINTIQKEKYGTYEIVLNTQPAHASFNFADLEWLVNYNLLTYNIKKTAVCTVDGNTLTYSLALDRNVTIHLKTTLDKFTHAVVWCEFSNEELISNANFTIIARIKQEFINEVGTVIDATKQVDINFNVVKPVRVEYMVFDNIETKIVQDGTKEYFVTFDERELGYTDSGYTTNNVKKISFNVYPQNALFKDLAVISSNSSAISAEIDNVTGNLTITARNKILSEYGTAKLTIWAQDSVNTVGGIGGTYTEISVRILNGTRYAPFEIANVNDLQKINKAMNSYYVLSDNINVGEWKPLGYTNKDLVVPFNGVFSGKNKTYDSEGNVLDEKQYYLSNLQVTQNYSYMGLFGIIGKSGVVEDLVINGVYIYNTALDSTMNYYIGAIAGYSEGFVKNIAVNDQSGVESFNGAYLSNLATETGMEIQQRGINITRTGIGNTTNIYAGGIVGFVNNTNLTVTAGILSTENEDIGNFGYNTNNSDVELFTTSDLTVPQIVDVNVSIEINVDASNSVVYVGGLAGFNNKAIITKTQNSSFEGINETDVIACINSRVLSAQNENSAFGGLIGFNNGEIYNYRVKALIPTNKNSTSNQTMNNVGGAVGYNAGAVVNNSAIPLVKGYSNIGGLIGISENTVVNFVNNGLSMLNGIVFENANDLVAFNKTSQIENITYSNLMLRVESDEYNHDEKTILSVLEDEFKTTSETFKLFANKYTLANNSNREHMVILQVENKNVNYNTSKLSYVYRPNEKAIKCRLEKNVIDNSIAIKTDKEIVSVEGVINALSNAKVNFVTGNKVEFLEGETLIDYKSSVVGYDNVGGLIGRYSGLYYQVPESNNIIDVENSIAKILDYNQVYAVDTFTKKPLTANMQLKFVNTLEYNSVYSYFTNSTMVNKFDDAVISAPTKYYGDILLEKSNQKYDVGGLIGETNNAFIQNNSANAGVQANDAYVGGLVGSAKNVVQIVESYFAGAILNNVEDSVNPQQLGYIIGDASLATQTGLNYGEIITNEDNSITTNYFYAPYAISSINDNKLLFNNIVNTYVYANYNELAGVDFVGNNVSTTHFYKMLNNYTNPNSDFAFIKDETKPVYNVSFNNDNFLYYVYNTGSNVLGMFKTEASKIDTVIGEENFITLYEKVLNVSQFSDFAGYTECFTYYELKSKDSNANGINDSDEVISNPEENSFDKVKNLFSNYKWYSYNEINNGLPVLLSKNKIEGTKNDFAVSLLVNFPPNRINVELNTNTFNIWGYFDNSYSTIYYYALNSSNYNNSGNLNFGNANLPVNQVKSLTNRVNNEISELNTYEIGDVLSYKAEPPFVGKNSFIITSSNTQILGVERINGSTKFVAKGTGIVTLTIASTYNASLKVSVKVNVVNAINNAELSYYTSGNKNVVNSGDTISIAKSTESNQQTFVLNSDLTGKFNFAYDQVNASFNLNENIASGVRYYYIVNKDLTIEGNDVKGYTVLHENRIYDASALPKITINGQSFTCEPVQAKVKVNDTTYTYKQFYTYYIDVPTGTTTNIVGLDETTTSLFAVPYFVTKNALGEDVKNTIIKVASAQTINGVQFEFGESLDYIMFNGTTPIAGLYTPNNIENYTDYANNCAKIFNINVVNASYKVTKSVSAINFFVQQTPSFYVDVLTDNKNAVLYMTYYGNNGEEKSIVLSEPSGLGLQRKFEKITINNLTLKLQSIDSSSFDDVNTTSKYIRYYFRLEVEDENKNNIQQVISKQFNFFIVKDNVQVNFDETGNYVLNDISEIALSSTNLSVTLNPQSIVSISMKHYPQGESTIVSDENGNQTIIGDLTEEAYDNIIPGFIGVLKINVSPVFANFDEIVLTSSTAENSVVWFNQVLANMVLNDNGNYVYDGTYATVVGTNDISGRIVLSKISNKLTNGQTNFDGNIYVKTLINSFVSEGNEFVLTAQAYKNGIPIMSQQIVLTVKTTPTLNLHVNGRDSAAVARGTSLTFSADHEGIDGEVDFTESYVYKIVNGVESVIGGYGTYFDIKKSGNNYVLETNISLNTSAYICIKGTISKVINGQVYVKSDILRIKVADFVIDSISVDNVVDGNFIGLFNQTYGLIVRINRYTCHPNLSAVVATQVRELEKQFSSATQNRLSNSGAWYVGTEQNHETINSGVNATQTFVFGKLASDELDNETIYSIQNIKFNSGDRLVARAVYCYTDSGVKPILNSNDYSLYESNEFTYDRYFEFGFGFYRDRNEDNPDPIATVEEFKAMEDGVDYILVNDLVLDDWEPFGSDLNINSLDGNGYVITINSFKLDEKPETDEELTDATFGLFTQINSDTVIKNLIIEVKPNLRMSIENETADKTDIIGDLNIDASAYKNITFGLLAGVNYGMVTNVQVVNDATLLKLEREVIIARNSANDYKYASYWEDGTFDELKFIKDQIGDSYTIEKDNDTGKISYVKKENDRDLSIIKVNTTITTTEQTHYMGLLVGKNDIGTNTNGESTVGYITNSSVENISINGIGYVAGFTAYNAGKISTSYFKGGNIINRAGESDSNNSATGGFVVFNTGNNASIQYSYVEGRLGDGSTFQIAADGTKTGVNADKTGLSRSIKSSFAGYGYNQDKKDGYNFNIAGLRAMNSAISSTTDASAFVYENNANVSNSYANILVKSSMKTSGFVFSNLENGTIDACFSLSSILVNNMDASPFTGRNSQYGYNNVNPNAIKSCHYLKLGCDTGDSDLEKEHKENFLDEGELATGIGASQFDEYNTFQSFAFNTDFTINSKEEVTRAVWFIPGVSTKSIYEGSFKNQFYSLSRPQLVAANLKTQSIRVWAGTETSTKNTYQYVSNVLGADVSNPILIKSAEEFNKYLNYESTINSKDRAFAIRFISDIAFNKTDLKANTYDMEYYGDLDGNGMSIKELRLVSDTDFETNNGTTVEYLGLFGRIITKPIDDVNSHRGVVRNLNIKVSEVRGSKVTYVGALAGEIQNANVFNVNISGNEIIQGKNVVGGLAGIISGDSEIVNVTSSLGVKASYYKYPNLFKSTNSQLQDDDYKTFEIYNKTEVNGKVKVANADTISYAGGIAGIFDVDARPEDEKNKRSLFNAKARSLQVSGDVSLVGEIVGGVFGMIGETATASDLQFIVSDNANPEFIASRIAGGVVGENRGSLERSIISQELETQNTIDNSYKASAVGTTYKIVNQGYSTLFGGNAHFIGGMVGFNNGGNITNSYSKVNVINIDSMYAGGFIGLNAGGKINFAYTTGSVKAFRGVGGFIGMQTECPVEINESKQRTLKEGIVQKMFLDYKSTNNITVNNLSNIKTTITNIVSANVWNQDDLYTDRSVNYNGNEVIIGALIGNIIMNANQDDKMYHLNNIFQDAETLNNRTNNNESIYFVQPLLNKPLGTNLSGGGLDSLLMPEIGAIESNRNNAKNKIYDDVRKQSGANEYAGLSGKTDVEDINNNSTVSFIYSRLQNIGSARTHLEIFETKINVAEAQVWGDNAINAYASDVNGDKDESKSIFSNWSIDYWTGVRKNGDSEATTADIKTAYPYLEPKAIKSRVLVYNVNQLKQMNTYLNAEFILQNDIDINGSGWVPVGTMANPFAGSLHSQQNPDGYYENYKIYDSGYNSTGATYTTNEAAYLGLFGVVDDANFHNFTLMDIKINNEKSVYVGSLFAYAKSEAIVNNVVAKNILINVKACTVGGLIGYGNKTKISNVLVDSIDVQLSSFNNLVENLNIETLYGFGGIAGIIGSEKENIIIANSINANNVILKLGTNYSSTNNSISGIDCNVIEGTHTINVGGVFGMSNPHTISNFETSICGINTQNIKIVSNLKVPDSVTEVNIGGIIGKSKLTNLTSLITEQENVETKETETYVLGNSSDAAIFVTVQNYKNKFNVGGVVGIINGSSNTIGLENITASGEIKVENTYNTSKTRVGGVAGYVNNINIKGLNKTGGKISVTATDSCDNFDKESGVHVGGLIGIAKNSSSITNSVVNADKIQIDITNSSAVSRLNVGGAFGTVDLSFNKNNATTGKISKVVSNVKDIEISGTSTAEKFKPQIAGGLIGTIFNGEVSECVSNTNLTNQNTPCVLGGLIGVVDINLYNKFIGDNTNNFSKVIIKNNYETGNIYYDPHGVLYLQQNVGMLVGLINHADSERELINNVKTPVSSCALTNNIAIGNFTNSKTFLNELKGGVLGAIGKVTTLNKASYEYCRLNDDSFNAFKYQTNLLINENYYVSDFITHSNNFGTGLSVKEMLFNNSDTFKSETNPWDSAVWTISNNTYPLLKWIEDSKDSMFTGDILSGTEFKLSSDNSELGAIPDSKKILNTNSDNTINYEAVADLQKSGLKIKPATSFDANADSVIFANTNYTAGGEINNKVYYFKNGGIAANNVNSVNVNSILYGITTTSNTITTNNGLITRVTGDNNLLGTNKGIIFNVKANNLNFINKGIVDSAIKVSGATITNNGTITNSRFNNSSIINGNVINTTILNISGDNKTYIIYDSQANTYSILLDSNNNATIGGSTFKLAEFLNGKSFDFENVWTVIAPDSDPDNQTKFNYGLPMLQSELKSDVLNNRMDNGYYWANDDINSKYSSEEEFNSRYENLTSFTNAEELAEVAAFTNYGYKISSNSKLIGNVDRDAMADVYERTGISTGLYELITTKYEFGIETKTVRHVYSFDGKIIFFNNNSIVDDSTIKEEKISFHNKLWIPIGFGAEDITADTLLVGQYLNPTIINNSNMFEGKISGNKAIFEGITSIGINKNVGLFGAVNSKNSSEKSAFASDILIRNSNFIAISTNNKFSSVGALAGFAYTTNNVYFTNKVGIESTNIYGANIASGLIGTITFADMANTRLTINKAYVNSSVYGGTTSGLAYIYGNNTTDSNKNAVIATEVYFVGELSSKTKYDKPNSSTDSLFGGYTKTNTKSNSVYAVDYYDANAMEDREQVLTESGLGVNPLEGFDWIETWVRTKPGTYPVFSTKVDYWIKYAQKPRTIDGTGKVITINPVTYTIVDGNNKTVTLTTGPQELAWVAKVVSNGGKDTDGTDYNYFNGWTIRIKGSLDMGGMVWTPIGYYINQTEKMPFQGTLEGETTGITLSNVMSTSVYVIDETSKTGVKAITNNSIGLVGYAENATIYQLAIDSCMLYGSQNIGSFIGYAKDSIIKNCSNGNNEQNLTYVGGYANVGGLVGKFESTSQTQLELSGNTNKAVVLYSRNYPIEGDENNVGANAHNFGGIAGLVTGKVSMSKNYNNKDVKGYTYVGGLVGQVSNGVTIDNTNNNPIVSNNTANVSGFSYIGGLVGYIADDISSINGGTNTGKVSANASTGYAGGIVGITNGFVQLVVNNGALEGAYIGGIIAHISNTNVYVNNVLNTATINNGCGIVHSTSVGFTDDMFGLCVTTDASTPIPKNANPYTSVFNNTCSLTGAAFEYAGMTITRKNIIEQNPYWNITSDNFSSINLDYTVKNSVPSIAPTTTIINEGGKDVEYFVISNENNFNYVNWLIKTNFINDLTSKVIKPLYLTLPSLSAGFESLSTNNAYPLKVKVKGSASNTIDVLAPKSLLGYVYNCEISDLNVSNDSSTATKTFGDNEGLIIKIGAEVAINNVKNVSTQNKTYYVNTCFGVLAGQLYNCTSLTQINTYGTINGNKKDGIGGLIGYCSNSNLENCSTSAKITNGENSVGGLIGSGNNLTLKTCSTNSSATVKGNNNIGGLIGSSTNSTIEDCSNAATVSGAEKVGGIIGYAYLTTINKSTNAGSVEGNKKIGGIVGSSEGSSSTKAKIQWCKNLVAVTMRLRSSDSSDGIGGIVGSATYTNISNNTNSNVVRGYDCVGGIVGYGNSCTINSNTSDENSVAGTYISNPTIGVGGIIGYSNASETSSGFNNTSAGFAGYISYYYKYEIRNLDSDTGYAVRNALYVENGTTYGNYYSNPSTEKFKVGTIFGNRSAGRISISATTDGAKSTHYVDQYTTYSDKYKGFDGSHCTVHLITYEANTDNGSGVYGGYSFQQTSDVNKKCGYWAVWFDNYDFNVYLDDYTVINSSYSALPGVSTIKVSYYDGATRLAIRDVVQGSQAEELILTKEGYSLEGWYTTSSLTTRYDFSQPVNSALSLYSKWIEGNKSIVRFDLQGGTGNSTTVDQEVKSGKQATRPSQNPTKSGVGFGDWYVYTYEHALQVWNSLSDENKDGVTFSEFFGNCKYDFSNDVDTDLTLYAHWSKAVVKFMTNETTTFATNYVDWGSTATKPASDPELAGERFQYWATKNSDGTYTSYNFNNAVASDLTLYAVFISDNVTVTWYDEEGNIATEYGTNGVSTVSNGDSIIKPTPDPTKYGYEFDGWYTMSYDEYEQSGSSNSWESYKFNFETPITTNIKLYQYFKEKTFIVSFVDQNGETVGISDQGVSTGGEVNKPTPDPVKIGYDFVGWYTQPKGALTDEEYESYKFIFYGELNAIKIMENTQIYAYFTIQQFTVTFLKQNGGLLNGVAVQTVNWGEKAVRPETDPEDPDNNGGMFRNWYTCAKNNDLAVYEYDEFVFDFDLQIKQDTVIYGYWEPAGTTYVVSFVDSNGNSLAGEDFVNQVVAFNEYAIIPGTIPVDPTDSENIFVGWYSQAKGSLTDEDYEAYKFNFESTKIIRNMVIYAYWQKPEKTVTFVNMDGTAFDSPLTQTVVKGETTIAPECPVEPEEGKTFKGWYTKLYSEYVNDGNGEDYEIYKFDFETTAITRDMVLYAYFE